MITQLPEVENLASLSAEARQILGVVGLLAPYPFRPDVIAAAFQPSSGRKLWQWLRRQSLPVVDIEAVWDKLIRAGLLRRESDRLVVANEVVYELAHQLSVAELVVKELIHTYEELARAHEAMTDEHKQELDAERPHLLAILRLCQQHNAWVPIRNIHISLRNYWPTCKSMTDQIEAYEIRVAAAYRLGDRQETARFTQKLGDACYQATLYEKAITHQKQALALGTTKDWRGKLLLRLGTAQMMHQQYHEALSTLHEANQICLETQEDRQRAKCLMVIGMVHAALADSATSEQHYTEAIRIASAVNDSQLEAEIESRLAQLYQTVAQPEKAISHFERSLWFYQHLNEVSEQVFIHTKLGELQADALHRQAAFFHYDEALMLAYNLGEPALLINCSFNMGLALREDQQFRQAIIYFLEVVATSVAQREPDGHREGLYQLGCCAMFVGEYEAAYVYWQELLALTQNVDRTFTVDSLISLIFIALKLDKSAEAKKWHDMAWEILADSEEFYLQAEVRNSQGDWYAQQGQLDEALAMYEQALILNQKAADGFVAGTIWQSKGFVYWDRGDVAAATLCFERAIALACEAEDEVGEWEARWHLGTMLAEHEPARAVELLRPRLSYYQKIEHTDADEDATFLAELEKRLSA